jgi:hypothetical protein
MRQYFPFTDYDFYAYLTAGAGLLFAIDLTFNDAAITRLPEWTVVKIGLATALAYVTGQITASLSSLVLEHWIAQHLLYTPIMMQAGLITSRRREQLIGRYFIGRYYGPLPSEIRKRVLARCGEALSITTWNATHTEALFHWCFSKARTSTDVAARLDHFRNLYGFNRNVAMVGVLAAPFSSGELSRCTTLHFICGQAARWWLHSPASYAFSSFMLRALRK